MRRTLLLATMSIGVLVIGGVVLAGCSGATGGPQEASKPKLEPTTVAGGGVHLGDRRPATSAGFCGPNDIAFDAAGSMYISDGGSIAAVPASIPFGR